jgi:hypothetical protein
MGLEACLPGAQGQLGHRGGVEGGVGDGVLREAAEQGCGVGLADPVEGDELGHGPVGVERFVLAVHEVGVGAGAAAHGLRGVVDEDVERPGGGDVVGEGDDLGGVAQVDADDLEPVDPLGAVGELGEPAHGVPREAGRDGQVRPVAQEHEGDVHADLGAPPGEQGAAAGEVGALITLGVRHRGAGRAEPVVERVDEGVVGVADVAAAGGVQLARVGTGCARDEGDAARLVVDAHG